MTSIPSFHAHIYYDEKSRTAAAELREELESRFTIDMGRWHDKPIGPHPVSFYRVAFAADQYPGLTQWLMLNRRGLTVLIHPETGDDLADHTNHAMWMGEVLALNLDMFE